MQIDDFGDQRQPGRRDQLVVRADGLDGQIKGLPRQWLRFGEPPLARQRRRELVQLIGDARMLGPVAP